MCMVVVVAGYGKALVGTEWAISLLCMSKCRKHSFRLVRGSISGSIGSFSVWRGIHWLESPIESLLISGHD